MSDNTDLVARLRNAAESWKRTDCMIARDVISEAALLDEAANELAELQHSAARCAKLETALEPFASVGAICKPMADTGDIVTAGSVARNSVPWADFDRARAALAGEGT